MTERIQNNGRLSPSARSAIGAFVAMDFMREAGARQAAGENIVHMEVGQPGTPAPRVVREAAAKAIASGTLGYTDALGHPALRERIAKHYREAYGLDIPAARVAVTTGSSAGFILAFLALLDTGDGIALPEPGYPCYRQIAKLLGLRAIHLPARAESHFKPRPADLSAALNAGTRAALLASPANPTGSMPSEEELESLVAIARENHAWFISDEIYHGLTYSFPAATALSFCDDAIVINSFSKYYSMTGWRVGWMVAPERLVRVFERLAQNLFISPPTVSQLAALAAFEAGEELEANKANYARNREMLLNELPKAGFGKLAPADGAFYLYADAGHLTDDSEAFVRRMLKEIGVAATPGIDFDEQEGHRFVRFSYAGTFENMLEAARRLRGWAAAL